MSTLNPHILCRYATISDRESIQTFVHTTHIQESVRNEIELKNQTDDLLTDFPSLVSDDLFMISISQTRIAVDDEGTIIGAAGLINDDDDSADNAGSTVFSSKICKCKLSFFFVSKLYRKQGIGRQLLKTLLFDAKQRGVAEVSLLTLRDVYDDAIRLYSKFGFVIVRELQLATYVGVDMVLMMDRFIIDELT